MLYTQLLIILSLLTGYAPKPTITSVELELVTRGSLKSIRMDARKTQIIVNGDTTNVTTPAKYWKQLLKNLKTVRLDSLPMLKTNSERSQVDAAYITHVHVRTTAQLYESPQFDQGTPPRELAPLIKTLIDGISVKKQSSFR